MKIIIIIIGTTDYLKPIDRTIVTISKSDAHLSRSIVDDDFYVACMSIVQDNFGPSFDLHRDVNVDNCLDVYSLLLESFPES